MKRTVLLMFFSFAGCFLFSCKKDNPDISVVDKDSSGTLTPASLFDSIPVIVWVEAAANFERLSTAGKMDTIFKKLYDMGARAVVMDVKGISGKVSYNSAIAEPLKSWNGATQAKDFDYLGSAVTIAKKNGLKVFASLSVFVEGMNYYGQKIGKVYTDSSFAAVQSQVMTSSGTVKKISEVYNYAMLNPLQPSAQSYELSLLKEVVSNYAIDGIVLDYCRYYDITSDFSNYSLDKFKTWAALDHVSATDIVKSWKVSDGTVVPSLTGGLFNQWLEFRSQTIHDFFAEARTELKKINKDTKVCVYVGAWYDSYYGVGVNWASDTYDPYVAGYSWATPTYKKTGYAELVDMCMTGNYTPTIYGDGWWTVQGEIAGTKSILKGAAIQYGSVDIGNTQWSDLQNMKDAITMIIKQTKGVMLFDLVHMDDPSNNQFGKSLYGDLKGVITSAEAAK